MDGLPVTIRLLDPPLHEFLPDGEMDQVTNHSLNGRTLDIWCSGTVHAHAC